MNNFEDITSVVQVIGCVFNDPSILDNADRYPINEEDFPEQFHRIVFGTMYNLHEAQTNLTVDSIVDYLSVRPKYEAIFKTNNGIEFITKASQLATFDTFNYYYSRLKKFTLLRAYNNCGLDVSEFYDTNNILDTAKKQKQEEWLDNTSLQGIAELVETKIEEVRSTFVENEFREGYQASDGIDELLADLEKHPEVGAPLYGRLVNTVTRGARLRKLYLRSAATGMGKCIPNSIKIPTPKGYVTVGQVKVGDYLFDAFGKPTKVLAVYPQGKKQIWEVEFKDGRKAQCCEEHLWSYCTERQRKTAKENRQFYTNTIKELAQKELYKQGHGYQILVPMQKAVQYSEKQYTINPYILGLFLGDGSFRYQDKNKSLMFSSSDKELVDCISNTMNWDNKQYQNHSEYSWYFEFKDDSKGHKNVWVQDFLKDYPELQNAHSEDKFIPVEYLQGSIEQRFELLNGLLDTDGSIDKEKGRITYYTVSEQLKNNVIELLQSLGFKATYLIDTHKDTLPCYKIEIAGIPEDKCKLFKLSRKKELINAWYNNGKRKELNLFNPIVKITPTNKYEEMTCFYVDNSEHLFLMNDYIVTHNTRAMIADAANFACGEIYDTDFNMWIKNGAKLPTLFIATEQDRGEVQTMLLAFLSAVNEEHILNHKYLEGEEERIKKAVEVLKEAPLWIEEMPDFSVQDIENCIKRHIRDHDVRYVCFDYIHTSMKILEEVTRRSGGVKLREDNILFILSTRLKDICNQYGVFIITATQLNALAMDAEIPDQNLLRGAKSIADRVDVGEILLGVTDKDLVKLEPVLAANPGFQTPNIKLSVYKNRRGSYKGVYLWCYADLGTCRIQPQFVTKYNGELVPIEDIKIIVDEPGAF